MAPDDGMFVSASVNGVNEMKRYTPWIIVVLLVGLTFVGLEQYIGEAFSACPSHSPTCR